MRDVENGQNGFLNVLFGLTLNPLNPMADNECWTQYLFPLSASEFAG